MVLATASDQPDITPSDGGLMPTRWSDAAFALSTRRETARATRSTMPPPS
jgi:hypothetical protein